MSAVALTSFAGRRWCAGLVILIAGLAADGCVSMQDEREIGRKQADEVERTVGLVRERQIVEYVQALCTRLAQAADRSDIAWQCSVADEPEPNAYALPGGWVYVTRGLLTISNREDELVGVLGHEMAHVIERHAIRRVGAATPLAVLFGVPSGVLGVVSPTLGGIVGGAGRLVSGLAIAPYSREQEREADRVGTELAARAGSDPWAFGDFLGTLERAEALVRGDASRRSSFLASHPSTAERAADVEALARSMARTPAHPLAGDRAAFLARLEGLVVGAAAADGVFIDNLFLHADLGAAIEMPDGWKTANSHEAAGAVAPDTAAVVLLQLVGAGADPVAGARSQGLDEALVQRIRRIQIGQLSAATLDASTRDGNRLALTWIAHGGRIFRVTGVSGAQDWERYRPAFERTVESFRPLRPADRERIMESRLRTRSARAGETISQVVARTRSSWSVAQAEVANGVTAGTKLEPGWPVKVAVPERYRGESAVAPSSR